MLNIYSTSKRCFMEEHIISFYISWFHTWLIQYWSLLNLLNFRFRCGSQTQNLSTLPILTDQHFSLLFCNIDFLHVFANYLYFVNCGLIKDFCLYFIIFAMFKNVVHTCSVEPGETPSYSAFHQAPHYV